MAVQLTTSVKPSNDADMATNSVLEEVRDLMTDVRTYTSALNATAEVDADGFLVAMSLPFPGVTVTLDDENYMIGMEVG